MLQLTWSWQPALYLFLGGMGAGAFIMAAVLFLIDKAKHRLVVCVSMLAAFVSLAVGLLLLLSELISPVRGMMMWSAFSNFSSWMTYGAWGAFCALVVWAVSAVLAVPAVGKALAKAKWLPMLRVVLAWVGIALGAFVAVYTGMLLMTAGGVSALGQPAAAGALHRVRVRHRRGAGGARGGGPLQEGPAGAQGGRPHGAHRHRPGGARGRRAGGVPLGHALGRPRERLGPSGRGLRPAAHLGRPVHRVLVDVRGLRPGGAAHRRHRRPRPGQARDAAPLWPSVPWAPSWAAASSASSSSRPACTASVLSATVMGLLL